MHTFDYTPLSRRAWDTETVTLLAKIHECKGRQQLYIRQKPAELERLVEIAKIQSTESSNKIEGIVTTSTRVRQLVCNKTTPHNRDEMEIAGYRDVLNTIHENHDLIPLKPSYILQLHRDLLRYTGLSYAGQFKNVQNYINETYPDGRQAVRFMPLAPYETPAAVEQLCGSYTRARAMELADPLLLIPCFTLDFLCIHPFNDGNGRMSRLLMLLLLYQNGFAVGKYISVEQEIERTKEAYYQALYNADQGWDQNANDPAPFIKYFLQVLLHCYQTFEERVGLLSEQVRSTAYDVVKAYAMQTLGRFTSAQVVACCPSVGRSSVLAALKRLTEEGVLIREGSGRSTVYHRAL